MGSGLDARAATELYLTELSLAEVARRLSVSSETVRRALIASGVARRPRGASSSKLGGKTKDRYGYVLVRAPSHPHATANGYIREHRLVMERLVGRHLRPEEVVHHLNGVKDDNRPENLRLYDSNSEHKREDMIGNQWAKGDFGNPKRRYRVRRTSFEILLALRELQRCLGRPIRRKDLAPPHPSYRAVARAFGSWQKGLALATDLEDAPRSPSDECCRTLMLGRHVLTRTPREAAAPGSAWGAQIPLAQPAEFDEQ